MTPDTGKLIGTRSNDHPRRIPVAAPVRIATQKASRPEPCPGGIGGEVAWKKTVGGKIAGVVAAVKPERVGAHGDGFGSSRVLSLHGRPATKD
jgi:hypothetical protein